MYRHSEIILQMIYRNNEEVWISKIDCMVLVISSVAKQMVEYVPYAIYYGLFPSRH